MLRALRLVTGFALAATALANCVGVAAVPASATQAAAFDSNQAWEHLRQMVSIGPRPAGSPGLRQTRAYITRQITAMGLAVQEQTFTAQTPQGPIEMVNLVVRLPGRQTDKILLTGHYDTKPFRDFTFVGANDGGSSGAFLIELARALKDRPREFTWELVWFDGEEAFCLNWTDCGTADNPDHTYGSRYYVKAARDAGGLGAIKAMILVDMIGEKGANFLRESESTTWLKDIIWSTAGDMGHGRTFVQAETGVEDDHYEFLKAGVDAVDIIDLDYYPHWHEATDTLDKLAAGTLQIVGDVLLASLPKIEAHLKR